MTTDCLNFLSDLAFKIGIAIFIIYSIFKLKQMDKKVDELEKAIDDQAQMIAREREQVRGILAEQNASILALEEQVNNNGSAEKIQELITKVKQNTADLVKIYEVPGESSGEEAVNTNNPS